MTDAKQNANPVFLLQNVSKTYDGRPALAPLDWAVPSGKTTILIGPSGCGKSTILRLLVGLIRPETGTVAFEGEPLQLSTLVEQRRRMGYVIQDGGLFPHLTARENVTLMARQLEWPPERTRTRVRELTELTHFPQDGLDRYPVQLSGGQRQRVALMRALLLDPDVLLLDEPLGALDPMIRADLQGDLRQIFRSVGKTVLLVTHDLGEAAFLGDAIVLMHEGRIVQQGRFEDLLRSPADPFVTKFVRAQRMSFDDVERGDS